MTLFQLILNQLPLPYFIILFSNFIFSLFLFIIFCYLYPRCTWQQSFELQPLMYRQRSSNSHSETFRERLGSYNESSSSAYGGMEHGGDDVFNATSPTRWVDNSAKVFVVNLMNAAVDIFSWFANFLIGFFFVFPFEKQKSTSSPSYIAWHRDTSTLVQ